MKLKQPPVQGTAFAARSFRSREVLEHPWSRSGMELADSHQAFGRSLVICRIPSDAEQRAEYANFRRSDGNTLLAKAMRDLLASRPNVLNRLSEIRLLQPGWDGDDASAVDPEIHKLATAFLTICFLKVPQAPDPIIVPMFDGRIQLEWHHEGRELEVELMQGKSAGIVTVESGGAAPVFAAYTVSLETAMDRAIHFVKWVTGLV